jgi:hypothetical protein
MSPIPYVYSRIRPRGTHIGLPAKSIACASLGTDFSWCAVLVVLPASVATIAEDRVDIPAFKQENTGYTPFQPNRSRCIMDHRTGGPLSACQIRIDHLCGFSGLRWKIPCIGFGSNVVSHERRLRPRASSLIGKETMPFWWAFTRDPEISLG